MSEQQYGPQTAEKDSDAEAMQSLIGGVGRYAIQRVVGGACSSEGAIVDANRRSEDGVAESGAGRRVERGSTRNSRSADGRDIGRSSRSCDSSDLRRAYSTLGAWPDHIRSVR